MARLGRSQPFKALLSKFNFVLGIIVSVKTQLGKARIQATVLKTQLGKARLTGTVNQTITGKAKIIRAKTSYGDKYVTQNTVFLDKYLAQNTVYSDEYF